MKKQWIRRLLSLSLASAMLLGVGALAEDSDAEETSAITTQEDTAAQSEEAAEEPAEEPEEVEETVSLSPNELKLTAGKSGTMTVSISPDGAAAECYTDDSDVATASVSGTTVTVTAVAQGECSVTVVTERGSTVTGYVTVSAKKQKKAQNKDSDNKSTTKTDDDSNSSDDQDDTNNSSNSGGSSGIIDPSASTISSSTTTTTGTTTTSKYTMPENIPENVMLTVNTNLGKATDSMLDDLYTYDCFATFFVNNDSIYKHDDRVRRIVGEGHSIGILLTADEAKTSKKALETVEEANNRLSTVSGAVTRLVSVEGGSAENMSRKVYKALKKAGYRVWDYDYAVDSSVSSESAFEALEDQLNTTERVVVRITSGAQGKNVMKEVLGFINYAEIPTQSLASSDIPVCSIK